MKYALNHMAVPRLGIAGFFDLAKSLGIAAVEIRNDLEGKAILDGTAPQEIRSLAGDAGVEIISINALQRFNEWNAAREREAVELAAYARDCGAQALVLVPVNDGSGRADGERQENVLKSLKALKPILTDHGITGLLEPLGFQICSLRSKREAIDAIDAADGASAFRLVHDTFHHTLAGEPDIFPDRTGLVHISGVSDTAIGVDQMLDAHRVMVGAEDRIGNIGQIRALNAAGYRGYYSFEPFAASIHQHSDPKAMIRESMEYIGRLA
jgi:2-keto-myo-inositol isomerase